MNTIGSTHFRFPRTDQPSSLSVTNAVHVFNFIQLVTGVLLAAASTALLYGDCSARHRAHIQSHANMSVTEVDGLRLAVTPLRRPLTRDTPPHGRAPGHTQSNDSIPQRLPSARQGKRLWEESSFFEPQNSVPPTFNTQCKAQHLSGSSESSYVQQSTITILRQREYLKSLTLAGKQEPGIQKPGQSEGEDISD